MLDLFDFFDIILDPITDLLLCGGDFAIWFRKRISSFLLGAGTLLFLLILSAAVESGNVVSIIIGAVGLIAFIVMDWRYTLWWLQYGRFGAEPPWSDKIPLPRGDLMNTPPEDAPFGRQPEPNIWEQMGVQE